MERIALHIAATVLLLACSAAVADDLYSGEVRVETGQGATQAALRLALSQVLLKHTGDPVTAADPAVLQAAGALDEVMLGYQFVEVRKPLHDGEVERQRRLLVEFEPRAIDRVLARQGLPRWSRERPELLVWLAIEDETVEFLPPDADWLRFALEDYARRRGVFILLPLQDAMDLATVSPEDVRGGFTEGALSTAARYGAGGVLLIDLRRDGERWSSRWIWSLGQGDTRLSAGGETVDAVIDAGLAQVAAGLAGRFRVTARPEQGRRQLLVTGVAGPGHYAEVLGYLQGLSLVERVHVRRAAGDQILFELDVNAGGLEDALRMGQVLEPAGTDAQTGADRYRVRW